MVESGDTGSRNQQRVLKRYSNVKVCDFTSGYSNEPVYGMIFSEEGIMKKSYCLSREKRC